MHRILIVDDNPTFRSMLKEILVARFPSTTIEQEPDGTDLISRIDVFHPDIVFMDIRLPGENGLGLTRKIKVNHPEITVIILTGYDFPEYRHAATQSKADYFITKDSSTQDFLALVESILTQKQSDHQKRPS